MKAERRGGTSEAENPLAEHVTLPALMKFAFPSICMMVFMGLYTIADTVFVARLVNTDALSAVNIVCPVVNVTVGLGTMLAAGANAVVSRQLGGGQVRKARENFTWLVSCAAAVGAVIAAAGAFFLDKIIWLLGASPRLFPYCRDYLGVLVLFAPACMLQTMFQNLFVTAGRPGLGFGLAAGAGCANILLDYLFIARCRMGIAGAALGTGIGYLIPAAAGMLFFGASKGALSFCRPKWRWRVLGESCWNGSSEMVGQMASAVTTFLFNRSAMELAGEEGVAAVTIMIYGQFLLSTVYLGFSMGVAPVLGYHYGGGNWSQLKRIFRICGAFLAVSSMLVFLTALVGGRPAARLFAGENVAVYDLARDGMTIFFLSFLFSGVNIFVSSMFTALSNGRVSAGLSLMRTFGFILLGLTIFPKLLGLTGLWLAVPAAECLAFWLSLWALMRYRGKYRYF